MAGRVSPAPTAPFFALLLAVMVPAFAQEAKKVFTDEEVVRISLEPAGEALNKGGFLPVRITVENRMKREGAWQFRFEHADMAKAPGSGPVAGSSARLGVAALSVGETVVFVPGLSSSAGRNHSRMTVRVSGPGVPDGRVDFSGFSRLVVAVAPSQDIPVRERLTRDEGSGPKLPADISLNICAPARWPADWRVWSPFDFVMLGADEFDALDGARRAALREWVALGGTLWLARERGGRTDETLGTGFIRRGGAADFATECMALRERLEKQGTALAFKRRHGHAGASGEEDERWLEGPWSRLVTLLDNDDLEAWEVERGTLLLVLFLIAFGIVVGPVNIYFLAPERRRHRLFLTVPAISVLASVLLGAVIVLADGFGGAGTRRALVVLMPGENKAAVFQQQVSRTGVLVGKSFAIEDDTALSREFRHGDASDIRMNREAGRADGAWFESRKRQAHSLWRVTPTRARVELAAGKNGAPPVVLSSLTTALNNFTYIDGAGESWGVEELAPGRRTPLEKLSPGAAAARFARKINPGGIERGHFYAWGGAGGAGGASGLAPLGTLKSIRWRDDTVLYTGRVEEARGP